MNCYFLVVVSLAIFCRSEAGSVPLTPSNYNDLVESAVNPFLVLYGASSSADQDDTFEQFSDRIQNNGVVVGRVDCTDKKTRKMCQGFSAKLPQLALYVGEPTVNPYTKKLFRKPALFEGTLAEKEIERFVVRNLPSNVQKVATMDELLNNTMIDWLRMPTVLFVNKKDTPPALIKVLSGHYKNRLQFKHVKPAAAEGEATTDSPLECEICDAFKIPPQKGSSSRIGIMMVTTEVISSVRISPKKLEDEAITQSITWFDGDLKNKEHVMKFLDVYALAQPHPSLVDGSSSGDASSGSTGDSESNNAKENPNTDSVFTIDSLTSVADFSPDFAWIVGVVKVDAAKEIPFWNTRIHKFGEGMVRVAEVRCGNQGEVNVPEGLAPTFGQLLCSQHTKKAPYVQIIPFEGANVEYVDYSGDRRKMISESEENIAALNKYAVKLPPAGADGKVRESAKVNEAEVDKSMKEIKKLAWDSFPDSEVTVVTEYDMQNFVTDGYIRGDKRALSIIILTSGSSSGVPSTFRNVALSMKQYYNCQFGLIQEPSFDYLQSVGNPPLPTMLILYPMSADADANSKRPVKGSGPEPDDPAQTKFSLAVYDKGQFGPMKFMSMLQFAMTVYSQVGVPPLEDVQTTSTANKPKEVPKTPIVEISTPEQWEEECGGGFRGLCALGIFDHSNGNSDWHMNLETWTGVRSELYRDSSLSDALMAYKFVYINGFCQHEFLEAKFGLSNLYYNVPTVLVFSSSKQRYSLYSGAFKDTDVRLFLKSILSGRSNVEPISAVNSASATMLSTNQCEERLSLAKASMDASAEVDSSGEMSDFLAEIRREEEEKQKQLEAELEAEKAIVEAEEAATAAASKSSKEEEAGGTQRRKVKRVVKKKKKSGK